MRRESYEIEDVAEHLGVRPASARNILRKAGVATNGYKYIWYTKKEFLETMDKIKNVSSTYEAKGKGKGGKKKPKGKGKPVKRKKAARSRFDASHTAAV